MKSTIGSSIICMDHLNFEHHAMLLTDMGIDFLHVDVMDGVFVPRYGIYPEIIKQISNITPLKMDLHLMVSDPLFALNQFTEIEQIEYVSVHLDRANTNILRVLDQIRDKGFKAVLVVDLDTEVSQIVQYVKHKFLDGLMFMGIHPGVLQQISRPEIVQYKLEQLRSLCDLDGLFIQCDGGVTFESIPKLREAGINNFVCGSSTLYKECDFRSDTNLQDVKIKENFIKIKRQLDVRL